MSGLPFRSELPPEARQPGLLALQGQLRRWLAASVEVLFPPRCAGCGRIDTYWCAHCQQQVERLPYDLPLRDIPPLTAVACTSLHTGPLRYAIHALKYEYTPQVARPLGERLIGCLSRQDWTIDMIVPIPLHTSRLKDRGYNQAILIGDYVATHFAIPCLPAAIERWRLTHAQVGLTGEERRANLSGAFHAHPHLVSEKNILLIDDVCTTGSTLVACADAALAAGARAVYGLTVTSAHS
jgi:ComF family protein